MDDLAAFLNARLDADERVALAATEGMWAALETQDFKFGVWPSGTGFSGEEDQLATANVETDALHIVRHAPARVLADVAAKRRLLQLHERVLLEHTHPLVTDAHLTKERLAVCASCEPPRQFRRTQSWPCPTLKVLALPFAGHPDYNESWCP
ncbi:DUF6221 family protein [Amycolatopsis sp. NPDC004772]